MGQKDYKSGQGIQIRAKRFQIGTENRNRGKRDYKPGQEILQIGAGIKNRCRTDSIKGVLLCEVFKTSFV